MTPRQPTHDDKKPISIEKLLEWTFGAERAELDPKRGHMVRIPRHLGYRSFQDVLNQTAILGCRVDTSASGATFLAHESSRVHWDAESVAAVVGGLLEPRVAEAVYAYARAGTRPTWMPGATPKIEPVDVHTNPHGTFPKTEPASPSSFPGGVWRPWMEEASRSTKAARRAGLSESECKEENRRHLGRVTPIAYRPSAKEIERTRAAYLGWWNALHAIREALIDGSVLRSHRLINEMPPASPWLTDGAAPTLTESGARTDWRRW